MENLRQAEWIVVLAKLEDIKATGRQARVKICGMPVEEYRIQRARRHCEHSRRTAGNHGPARGRSAFSLVDSPVADIKPTGSERLNLGGVQIDVLEKDGQWQLHTTFEQSHGQRSSGVSLDMPDIPRSLTANVPGH